MLFLYIAAAVCVVVCAANAVMLALALRAFCKWRGSVLARFADLDAMIAALPAVLREELSSSEPDADDREERSAQDRKNGVDITEDVMNMLRYSVEDAFGALRGNGGDGE